MQACIDGLRLTKPQTKDVRQLCAYAYHMIYSSFIHCKLNRPHFALITYRGISNPDVALATDKQVYCLKMYH